MTASIGETLLATVPFARTLGIEFTDISPDRAGARLPDLPEHRNHVGGPHAGALFSLGESASGAVVLGAFGDQLERAVPLAVGAQISYRKLAMGPITAIATLDLPPAEVIAALDAGDRPEFPVEVELAREDGAIVATMTVTWTLRPH